MYFSGSYYIGTRVLQSVVLR